MNFEIGKEYIVQVTDGGIIPIDEFNRDRFFDKDNDDLELLTAEEKQIVIKSVLEDIKAEIADNIAPYIMVKELYGIINKYIESEDKELEHDYRTED